ncbi:MAG TPA: branched-chain amino acid ABC transporter permease [Spirochaetia bacterium]|nr:branched-chain amino acid ABC transporter permease [Spirochaetia bacterium]
MGLPIYGLLSFLASFAVMASIYAIFAIGLNVHWGYTGLLNFGIAGFFAIGAYTSALVTSPMPTGVLASYIKQAFGLNAPFLVGVLSAAVVSGLIAALVGLLTLRLSEGYLAISTIGIAESIRIFFNNESWLANGPQGLIGLPQPLSNILPPAYYSYVYLVIVLIFLAVIYVAVERGIRSPWGRVLRAIKEDEVMSSADGKNVFFFKLQALVFGAMIMGIGGALYAHYSAAIQPGVFEPLFGTFIIWTMLILGGTGNNKGAILGSFIVWSLWSWSTFFILKVVPRGFETRAPYIRYILIGLLLVIIMVRRPKGIIGEERQVSKF